MLLSRWFDVVRKQIQSPRRAGARRRRLPVGSMVLPSRANRIAAATELLESRITPVIGTFTFALVTTSVGEADGSHDVTVTLTTDSGNLGAADTMSIFVYDAGTGSATNGGVDYDFTDTTLTFDSTDLVQDGAGPGYIGSKTVTVTIVDDALFEGDENVSLELKDATASNAADTADDLGAPHVVLIVDDEFETVTIEATTATTTEGDPTPGRFKVSIPTALSVDVIVSYSIEGTATATDDYTALTGTVKIIAGQTHEYIDVASLTDATPLYEGDETVIVTITGTDNASVLVGDPQEATVTILDADPIPSITIADNSGTEGVGNKITFTVSIDVASTSDVTVKYATIDGSAHAGDDYVEATGTVTIPAGMLSADIDVNLLNDNVYEGDETFSVKLFSATGAVLGGGSQAAVGTITDDETAPTFKITPVLLPVTEGTLNSDKVVTFIVTVSSASTLPMSVSFATNDVTAKGGIQNQTGVDYGEFHGTLTWQPFNAGSKTISVHVYGDFVYENTETFQVNLSNPVNGTIVPGFDKGVATITDDDVAPSISINSVTVTEGTGAGTTTANFTVKLSNPSGADTTVKYKTADGTALAPADYTALALSTLTIPAGQTSGTISVLVKQDALNEINETFSVILSAPSGGTIAAGKGTGTGTITDDDSQPTVTIGNASAVAEGGTLLFPVTLSKASGKTITVPYTTQNGTAGATDFTAASGTLTFAPGSLTPTPGGNVDLNGKIKVVTLSDAPVELSETMQLKLTSATNATLGNTAGTGTITDLSPKPVLSISNVTMGTAKTGSEGGSIVFTVTLSQASALTVTVSYSTFGGTATSGTDFVAKTGVLTFLPGVLTQTITIVTKTDTLHTASETAGETFTVKLGANATSPVAPTNATINAALSTGIGKILDI